MAESIAVGGGLTRVVCVSTFVLAFAIVSVLAPHLLVQGDNFRDRQNSHVLSPEEKLHSCQSAAQLSATFCLRRRQGSHLSVPFRPYPLLPVSTGF